MKSWRHGALDVWEQRLQRAVPKLDEATAEDFDKTFHRGLTSISWRVSRRFTCARKVNSIINIAACMAGCKLSRLYGTWCQQPAQYPALKAGFITDGICGLFCGHGIRVNAISPVLFLGTHRGTPAAGVIETIAQSPLKRMGRPHESKALLLLASEAAALSRQNIVIDGGWTTW